MMLQVLAVHLLQVSVIAENKIDVPGFLFMPAKHSHQPVRHPGGIRDTEVNAFLEKQDRGHVICEYEFLTNLRIVRFKSRFFPEAG